MTVMRSSISPARNCHVAQGFKPYPFPDDMNAQMEEHKGYSSSSPPANFAGTAFYNTGSQPVIEHRVEFFSNNSTVYKYMPFSLHSFYPTNPAVPITIYYKFVLVPYGQVPSFNSSNGTWTFPAGSRYEPVRTATSSLAASRGFTMFVPVSESFYGVTPNIYRVWVQVDPYYSETETDEGDNVFPTDYIWWITD